MTDEQGDCAAVDGKEPQHGAENLVSDIEHGRRWVTCHRCGRQWDSEGEVVSDGDGFCDDNPET